MLLLAPACAAGEPPVEKPAATATPAFVARSTTPPSAASVPADTPFPTPAATPAATPSPTPDPYAALSVQGLAARAYGGGELQVKQTMVANSAFTRLLVTYPSDGLTIYGFMNVPRGQGPFPVVLVLHGYVSPSAYNTLAYTTRYADALARAGYLAIHPNYRGYPPSDDGPNSFRAGFAVDVLNLIAIVRQQGGKPGPLQSADPNAVGLWGHSMGGGISLRVLTVDTGVRAAVLYGSMSGDDRANFERIIVWSGGQSGREELNLPDAVLARVSPIHHLDRIRAAVSIHHGERDGTVPPQWSVDLCERLKALNKPAECFTYRGQPHTFTGEGDQLFNQRVVDFFDRQLKGK